MQTVSKLPYDEGYDANESGLSRDSNPYPALSEAGCQWHEGWDLMAQVKELPEIIN